MVHCTSMYHITQIIITNIAGRCSVKIQNLYTYLHYLLWYKIIATCIECATVLWVNNTHITRKYKAGEDVPCYSRLIN